MARLIFLFFAEDTSILNGDDLFTATVTQMSDKDSSNTHEVMSELFRAMNTPIDKRAEAKLPRWADVFPYVNGGLFSGSTDVPRFSKIARSYLLHIGSLDWTKINPDIFGSMIQAVADDEERGALGMHYTSVPNILKVLNPLFLDDLNAQLDAAGDNKRKLDNLRKRLSKIRVFDPACGSGNFLVIAYKEMRAIEAKINAYCGEPDRRSEINIENFRGIELRDFPAEIARLALIIAEYQCDVTYRGQKDALAAFLPLDSKNWITQGNALRIDWLTVCPPTSQKVDMRGEDLFMSPLEKAQIDFKNEGGETYICGNPPFKGARKQSKQQKEDLKSVFVGGNDYKDCDYVCGWFVKAAEYSKCANSEFAFVSTNSISRGDQVQHLWSRLYQSGMSISFAYQQFQWRNNASDNAGVWCVIVGCSPNFNGTRRIFADAVMQEAEKISPYLIAGAEGFVSKFKKPLALDLPKLVSGNMARDGGNLILSDSEKETLVAKRPEVKEFLRELIGTTEIKNGTRRWAIWINDDDIEEAEKIPEIRHRIEKVKSFRLSSSAKTTQGYAAVSHRFAQRCHQDRSSLVLPKNTVEGLPYITPDFVSSRTITTDLAFVSYTNEVWLLSLLSSRVHTVWAEAISGGLGSGVRYSSEITYNAFPVPKLTEKNKEDLTRCAEDILLAREAHFPATIADLYKPDAMPENLRAAHDRNDEVLERIYIGRRFRNDTERLEKLFEMYTKMTTKVGGAV
ncbi:lactate dehydrogenase [Celeribacter sp. ASW11-22]|nr:lactate dehydrogenase [Celeribacter litoreus]